MEETIEQLLERRKQVEAEMQSYGNLSRNILESILPKNRESIEAMKIAETKSDMLLELDEAILSKTYGAKTCGWEGHDFQNIRNKPFLACTKCGMRLKRVVCEKSGVTIRKIWFGINPEEKQ